MTSSILNLWAQAASELSATDQLPAPLDLSLLDTKRTIQDILEAAKEKQKECLSKRWKYKNRKGDDVIIQDVFAKVITWATKFIQIGDTVMQYDPGHAALPWAGVRLLLQIAVNDSQTMGAMSEGVELVSNLISRCAVLENLYFRTPSAIEDELVKALLKLYTAILIYLSKALKYYEQRSIKRAIKSIVQTPEHGVEQYIENITKEQTNVDACTRLVNAQVLNNTREDVQTIIEGLESLSIRQDAWAQQQRLLDNILADLNGPINRTAIQLKELNDSLKVNERLKIFQWLSAVKYQDHHRAKAKALMDGSCQWLFEKPEFLDWRKSSTSSILWLHGIPGSGKSMLVASVIKSFLDDNLSNSSPAPIAYCYCARNTAEPERADPNQVLGCILEQLSSSDSDLPIRAPVVRLYKEKLKEAKGREMQKLDLDETVDIIMGLLAENPATIVIDALDECDSSSRQNLLLALNKLVKTSPTILKVFVSSRDDHDIVHRLAKSPNLFISTSDNSKDIQDYIRSQVSLAIEDERLICGDVSEELKEHIVQRLTAKAEGMFRLPSLHIETLCDPLQVKTEDNVRYALERLPKKLNDSYDLIYEQISNSQYPNPELASRIMRWMMCAQRQLHTDEFIAAISIEPSGQYFSLSKANVLSICCNLLIHDSEQDTFRFTHLSVREYVEKLKDFNIRTAHTIALDRCLHSLFGLVELEGAASKSYQGLLSYAGDCTPKHHDELHKSSDIQVLSESLQEKLRSYFYSSTTAISFSRWIAKDLRSSYLLGETHGHRLRVMLNCLLDKDINCPIGDCERSARLSEPQNTNTLANISLIQMLLEQSHDTTIFPLPLAAKQGNNTVVHLLLRHGAYENNCDAFMKTAFEYAVEQNNDEIVTELKARNDKAIRPLLDNLETRRKIKKLDSANKTPLSYAIDYSNDELIRALLEHGAWFGQRDHKGQTDLHRASKMGYELAVQLLLTHSGDVNIRNDQNETPLIVAAQHNQGRIVEILLEKGADVHHLSYLHENALHIVVAKGDATRAALLVDHGAKVNFWDYRQKIALHIAAASSSAALVQVLLDRGADVAAKDLHGNTSLRIAAVNGHAEIVSLLLQQVEDDDTRSRDTLTALNAAIESGQPEVVKMLLRSHVDLANFQKDMPATILNIGDRVDSGRYATVAELLFDSLQNINTQDYRGQTIVHQTAKYNYGHLLEILLRRQPNVDLSDDNGEVPIHIAARNGNETTVRLLLASGADVNATKLVTGHTALHIAAEAGHVKILCILVDAEADVNAELSGGETPLHLAAEKGHDDIVKMLYDLM